jgi:hypothetical protein
MSLTSEQSMLLSLGSIVRISLKRWAASNKFADGKDTYHNKRTRSAEDDRSHRYNNQKHIPRNYDNYISHSQLAAGYRENNNQWDKHQNSGYRNDNKDNSGTNMQFRPRTSRDYNQSPNDILNGPCHIHYTYVDRKGVLNYMMKDCRTFIKLQEATWSK